MAQQPPLPFSPLFSLFFPSRPRPAARRPSRAPPLFLISCAAAQPRTPVRFSFLVRASHRPSWLPVCPHRPSAPTSTAPRAPGLPRIGPDRQPARFGPSPTRARPSASHPHGHWLSFPLAVTRGPHVSAPPSLPFSFASFPSSVPVMAHARMEAAGPPHLQGR